MANRIRILRRTSNGTPPSVGILYNSEICFNEVSDTLFYGKGNNGSNIATSIIPIGGSGNFVDLTSNQSIGGNKTFTTSIISSISTGTAPLTIASTTVVSNLNSDYLDGQHGSYYLAFGNFSGNASIIQGGTGLTSVGTANQLLGVVNAGGSLEYKTINGTGGISITYPSSGNITITGSGGTVTSVGLSMPSIFTVTNSPVTGSGTLTASFNTQSANNIFAGPTSGIAAIPSFRNMVNADLPTSGITAGTYIKTTFNDKGIATAGGTFGASDVNTALGYTAANDSGVVHIVGTETITGAKTFTSPIISSVSIGTAPLTIASTTVVSNLNSDYLDGQHGSYYLAFGNFSGNATITQGGTGLTSVGTANQLLGVVNAGGSLEYKTINGAGGITITYPSAGNITITGSGGTVTSVGLSMPSIFTVTNSPITGSGTLTASFNTQSANNIFAGPTSGIAAIPSFRNMVNADLPTSGITAGTYIKTTFNDKGIAIAGGTFGASDVNTALGYTAANDSGVVHIAGTETITGAKTFTNVINEYKGSDIISSATTDLSSATGNYINITGNNTITSFGTVQAGALRYVNFSGSATLTYNATSLIIPGSANIITQSDDSAILVSLGSGNWKILSYQRRSSFNNIGKQTLYIPAGTMTPRKTAGCSKIQQIEITGTNPNILSLNFDTAIQEYSQFSVAMPKSYDFNQPITAQIIWTHPATTTNFGVVWGVHAASIPDNSATQIAFGTLTNVADIGGVTNNQYITSETSAIGISGTGAIGNILYFEISRIIADANDTLAVDARLTGIKLFYSTNSSTDN